MDSKLLSIRQMARRAKLTTGSFYCWRSRGSLKLDWVIKDKAVFATEESFLAWMAARAAKKRRAKLKVGVTAKGGN